ncbi:MAG: ribbon-helix-helix protein, CopG family [Elusimicrobia bacterium]|nr:ribbon-helix-helix protein, CopG family [Elusimicrobiota bacterium]
MDYVATNIRLPKDMLQALKIQAAKEGKSMAQMIREALRRTFGIGAEKDEVDPRRDPFYNLVGAWESGIADGAEHHDKDIYGTRG